nr:MAG TPA: hypothetical protein [Caudoviricetes sp.]
MDLKNDCLLSIFLKLPTFKENFEDFCYDACKDTYYSLREKYFAERNEKSAEDWVLDKIAYRRNFG